MDGSPSFTHEGYYDPEKGAPVYKGMEPTATLEPGIASARGYKQDEQRLERLSYSHDAMIDQIIAEPRITQAALAAKFGYTPAWVSRVIGSDAFQAALAKRRQEITDPFLIATVGERLTGVINQSLDIIADKLHTTQSADLALKAADMGLKAAGFGARNAAPGTTVNNFVVALPGKAPSAEQWAEKASNGGYLPAIEHQGASNLSTTITRDPTIQPAPTQLADSEDQDGL